MIGVYFVNTTLLILVFNLLLDKTYIVYPIVVSFTLLLVYLFYKLFDLYRFSEDLKAIHTPGVMPNYINSAKDQLIFTVISEIHTAYNDKLAALNEKLSGRNALFTSFIHNMKSSVAVIELASGSNNIDKLSDIVLENEKLKKNLEQALTILRLDEFANDYVPESVELRELVCSVINEKRRDFIYAGIYPKLFDEKIFIYTDQKWCRYMIEQILANAIKYSKTKGKIYFEIERVKNNVILNIRDEGIGIPQEDIPRVFELFYTGQNGRLHKNSATGIGLAIVKQIAKQLGHKISLTSAVGKGTCVSLTFLSKM
jgi:signal transduction histidine kinase